MFVEVDGMMQKLACLMFVDAFYRGTCFAIKSVIIDHGLVNHRMNTHVL